MQFNAFERNKQGTGASRRLRNAGRAPGIVYGGTVPTTLIEIDHNELWYALKKEAFHGAVLEMNLGGAAQKVLLRDVQYHPYKPLILHIDFQRVDASTKLSLKVPLHFKGEEESSAVKIDKCLVNHIANEVEITCLAADIPEFIEVNLSALTKGQTIHASDLQLPKGVKVAVHGKVNPSIVSVSAPVAEEAPAAE